MRDKINENAATSGKESSELNHELKELREMLKILNKQGPITRGEAAKVRANKLVNRNQSDESINLNKMSISESINKAFHLLETKHGELIEQQTAQSQIRRDLRVAYNEMSNIHQQLRECKAKIGSQEVENDEQIPKKRGRYEENQTSKNLECNITLKAMNFSNNSTCEMNKESDEEMELS